MRVFTMWLVIVMTLSACDQVTVNGPVGGAEITVTELRSGTVVFSGITSDDLAAVDAARDTSGWDDLRYLRRLGQFNLRDLDVAEDTWYLVTLTGGLDYDSNGNQLLDTGAVPVAGPIRGLLTGAEIRAGGHNFGALSEAAWQWVREHYPVLDDSELASVLDELSRSLVLDVWDAEETGVIEYRDLVAWNSLFHGSDLLLASVPALESLRGAIISGAGDTERLAIVNAMTNLAVPAGVSGAWFEEVVSPQVSQGVCYACHGVNGWAYQSEHFLAPDTEPGHLQQNIAMYANLVASNSAQYVLDRARGIGHQGGIQLDADSAEYAAFVIFLNLLEAENAAQSAMTIGEGR